LIGLLGRVIARYLRLLRCVSGHFAAPLLSLRALHIQGLCFPLWSSSGFPGSRAGSYQVRPCSAPPFIFPAFHGKRTVCFRAF
jgi:hypothetical protein